MIVENSKGVFIEDPSEQEGRCCSPMYNIGLKVTHLFLVSLLEVFGSETFRVIFMFF